MKLLYKRFVEKRISHFMREYRKKHRLTQEQMAEKLFIDVRSYSDIERQESGISLFTFLCFIANCEVDIIAPSTKYQVYFEYTYI